MIKGSFGWSEWSSWSMCTKSCNMGLRNRYRYCHTPEAFDERLATPEESEKIGLFEAGEREQIDFKFCPGASTQQEICNTDHCPGTFCFVIVFVYMLHVLC